MFAPWTFEVQGLIFCCSGLEAGLFALPQRICDAAVPLGCLGPVTCIPYTRKVQKPGLALHPKP